MVRSKGIVYPRIVEEVVDYHELMKVWNCSYITAHRVLHGIAAPNHIRKQQLSDYLGIPVDELWVRVDSAPHFKGVAQFDTPETTTSVGEILEG